MTPRRSLTGEVLPPALPATAAELAAGAIGPTHLRVITAGQASFIYHAMTCESRRSDGRAGWREVRI